MDWDEILDPFSHLYQETLREQQQIVNVQDGLIAAARQLAEEHYPEIYHLEAEGYKALETVIISACVRLSCQINDVILKNQSV
ncbi:hypothetical protein KTO58_27295 [Chitinophaga pendula]|uniref:hypothetical protein n=1 Tax=Chitinophaga TaxID=79328 RepID=UPI000BAF2A42|nr:MULTISPECIES: hypothetical protein [Chitinophaga]ASZ09735.1 hypothetical protein CK934_01465 [Chitinophaga sp. MD30]UCJ07322.1 hypothetical protein KTO58_27295 [Chitinophaga pendula]